jgi:hypothetical protein
LTIFDPKWPDKSVMQKSDAPLKNPPCNTSTNELRYTNHVLLSFSKSPYKLFQPLYHR